MMNVVKVLAFSGYLGFSQMSFFSSFILTHSLIFLTDGPVPLPNMPNQIMNRMQVSQGMSVAPPSGVSVVLFWLS